MYRYTDIDICYIYEHESSMFICYNNVTKNQNHEVLFTNFRIILILIILNLEKKINLKQKKHFFILTNISVVLHCRSCTSKCKRVETFVKMKIVFSGLILLQHDLFLVYNFCIYIYIYVCMNVYYIYIYIYIYNSFVCLF